MLDRQLAWRLTVLRNQIRCEVAAQKFLRLLREIRARRFEEKYRPDQPRAPRGTPIGGQWIDDTNSARQEALRDDRVQVAQARPSTFYDVDIRLEDAKGGHGWRDHVQRSRAQLRAVMDEFHSVVRQPDGGSVERYHPAEGSFWSTGEANFYVSETLRANPEQVELAVGGSLGYQPVRIRKRFDTSTGYEAYRTDFNAPILFRDTYWVEVWIVYSPNSSQRGYRVDTAYPMNAIANEELSP